jgi:RNA 2',3'-cyclic 3'-phosphodiesterase
MSSEGNLVRDRMRLFYAFKLPDETVARLVSWQAAALRAASGCRIVAPENLHFTLAFLGSRPAAELPELLGALSQAAEEAGGKLELSLSRYRETRSVGMLVFEDAEGRAGAVAAGLFERLETLGVYERERRPWLPHVTVLRFRRPPRLRPELPDLGVVSPSDLALYHSVLRPSGAQYHVLDSVALGG